MTTLPAIAPEQSLAALATSYPAASRVFHRHGLDFCCGGRRTLAEVCAEAGLDAERLAADIAAEAAARPQRPFDQVPLPELVQHILDAFHAKHREELPRLVAMAEKVERVHAEKATCPHGLTEHLRLVEQAMEEHMQKEEQILFPMILAGRGRMAGMPIQVMEEEHRDHAANLVRTRQLATEFEPPAEACGTWRALYLGLEELERDLMEHVHLENNVLFPRALMA